MDKTDCEDRACGAYEKGGEGVVGQGKMRGEVVFCTVTLGPFPYFIVSGIGGETPPPDQF